MSIDAKWLTREKWTLIEAALIFAGIEPYAGGPATDDPHLVLQRLEESNQKVVFVELYSRSKDAIGGGLAVTEPSRTGLIGNTRVGPFEYLRWAFDSPLPAVVREHIDWEALRPVSGPWKDIPLHLDWTTDPRQETVHGYTIDGAASELHERYGVDEEAMKVHLRKAIWSGDLLVVDQRTGIRQPIQPSELRDFHSRIRTVDLNVWLDREGVEYRLGKQIDEESDAEVKPSPHGVTKGVIIGRFRKYIDPDKNVEFWKYKLSDPPLWLKGARIAPGGKRVSALWDPVMVAHCLLDRGEMTVKQLDKVMAEGFPSLRSRWETETEDLRR